MRKLSTNSVLAKLYSNCSFIFKLNAVFFCFGLFYVLSTPVQYTSTVIIIPAQQSTDNLSQYSSFVTRYGLNRVIDIFQSEFLNEELFTKILASVDFESEVIHKIIYFDTVEDSIKINSYFLNHNSSNIVFKSTPGLVSRFLVTLYQDNDDSLELRKEFNRFSEYDLRAMKSLRKSMFYYLNPETSVLTLKVTSPHPGVSVQIARIITQLLDENLNRIRNRKINNQLIFFKEREVDARNEFEIVQMKLADLNDKNQGSLSAEVLLQYQNIQNQLKLKFDILNYLSHQVELSEIRIKEHKPNIEVIQDVRYPYSNSYFQKVAILINTIFAGTIFGVLITLTKNKIKEVYNLLKDK